MELRRSNDFQCACTPGRLPDMNGCKTEGEHTHTRLLDGEQGKDLEEPDSPLAFRLVSS